MDAKIEISLKDFDSVYQKASKETKKVLDSLFGSARKPTLEDYTSIKTYEDACIALGISPVLNCSNLCVCEKHPATGEMCEYFSERMELPNHIKALMKLEIISRALWGKNWKPVPDAEGRKIFWYPWFALFTKDEINSNKEDFKKFGALLAASADGGTTAGFGCLDADFRSSRSSASVGFRLCQENEDKARYFGTQFIELWAEYLAYNFAVGGRIEL